MRSTDLCDLCEKDTKSEMVCFVFEERQTLKFCVLRKDTNSEMVPQSSPLRKRVTSSALFRQGRRSLVRSFFPVDRGSLLHAFKIQDRLRCSRQILWVVGSGCEHVVANALGEGPHPQTETSGR